MTVKQLIEWCDKAIVMREKTWIKHTKLYADGRSETTGGNYEKNLQQCLHKLMPEKTTIAEASIASHLVNYGNEIFDWNSEYQQKIITANEFFG